MSENNYENTNIQPLTHEDALRAESAYHRMNAEYLGSTVMNLSQEMERLREQATIDPLTGIWNRRRMEETFHGLVAEHPIRRHDETMPAFRATHTAIMIDLDNFRDINNNEGHAAGDAVLKAVAEEIGRHTRDRDALGRIGGDELAIFLARTNVDKGVEIADAIRQGLDDLRIGPKSLRMTASIGVAELVHADTMEEGLRPADIAAYASKEAGRNRVTLYDPSLQPKGE